MYLCLKKGAEAIYMYPYPIVSDETAPMASSLCMESSLYESLLETKRNREQGVKGIPASKVLAKMDTIINGVEAHK